MGQKHGVGISKCSNDDICVGALAKVDRSAEPIIITVIVFVSVHIFKGFFEEAGKSTFTKLREILVQGGEQLENKTGRSHVAHFKTTYDSQSQQIEVIVKCTQAQLIDIPDSAPDLDKLREYLDRAVGDSDIIKVVVEMTDSQPYWRIIHFVDSDGKLVDV